MLWLAVESAPPLPIGSDVEPELRRDHHACAMRPERLAHEFFVREWAVSFRRIEECDAAFDGCSYHRNALPLFEGWTVAVAQSHATEAESRNFQTTLAKFALLHRVSRRTIPRIPRIEL